MSTHLLLHLSLSFIMLLRKYGFPALLMPILLAIFSIPPAAGAEPKAPLVYELAISFDLDTKELTGTAKITVPPGVALRLDLTGLLLTALVEERSGEATREYALTGESSLDLVPHTDQRVVFLSYIKQFTKPGDNLLSRQGIVLLSHWYPRPQGKALYSLQANLPKGFTAITESDRFPLAMEGGRVRAICSLPLDGLHFAAGPYGVRQRTVRKGLSIYTLFFPEEEHLADEYLEKGAEAIRRYEGEIGPFPYNHYVIAANRQPTGLGLPTFTLLGQAVLRLPFITSTSLGHEILHSWFGNSVTVAAGSGNWCEGLTSYLADHNFRQDKGEGNLYRLEAIRNYHSYIHADNRLTLGGFVSAGHRGMEEKVQRAIGYSRAMLLFHELREKLGVDRFMEAVRLFYTRFRHREASWHDLQQVFEESSQRDLDTFFKERLQRADIPKLTVTEPRIESVQDATRLTFTLHQQTDTPYELTVPIRVDTLGGSHTFVQEVRDKNSEVVLHLPRRPLSMVIDPDLSFLRALSPREAAPIWSAFLGSDDKLVIIRDEKTRQHFAPLLDQLADASWTVIHDDQVKNSELAARDLLFLGSDQTSSRSLFGTPAAPEPGFTLQVRPNPLNPERVAVLIDAEDQDQVQAAAGRLGHYGNYAALSFLNGKPRKKQLPHGNGGITVPFEELPAGGNTAAVRDFNRLMDEIAANDVIYLGETHTSTSDHRLQLRVIEAVAATVAKPVIGMEMFPVSSQAALDQYILGDTSMTEREFLKASNYFQVWSYDFRYFREIFNFARRQRIPIIGLNLDRAIVSSVFKSGSLDDLSEEQRTSLPGDRNLDLPGYGERLLEVFHAHGGHADGKAGGFIQAQGLWDETMAANIVNYLEEHPGSTMLVLAGSQHTRKDSGIPPRVAARMPLRQTSIVNIARDTMTGELVQVADYYFFTDADDLPPQGKLGIVLEELEQNGRKAVCIRSFTENSRATGAGLEAGDVLVAIDAFPIAAMEDVRIAMLDALAGETITVEYRRGESETPERAEVELVSPSPPGHP